MPLLKRKAFEKSTASEYLRDDDEVFHCEITDEIFKDYEEYCERIILVNSMVWTCEMTGKNNLTYAEALESEKAARIQLRDFPTELRIPILFLATKTKRSSFAELCEDVFNYVRERYFVGEAVEACLEGDHWAESHVLSVTAQAQIPGSNTIPLASAYCYEVEQFENDSNSGQIGSAPHDRVRRRKGVYSREKNRLFLKQFVQQGPGGVICIKKIALDKYNIHKVNFEQIFTGKPPEFASSKKLLKTSPATTKSTAKPGSATKVNKSVKKPSPDKKGGQVSMDKFVKKTDKIEAPKAKAIDPAAKKNAQDLADRMRKAEDQLRQKKEDEKAKKKEKTAKLQAYLKEWQKVKDDMELEDQKIIPNGTVIQVEGIPPSNFGDFLSVLEFVHNFSDILKVKDIFHNDLDFETLRKALTIEEHAGLLCDLVQMLLSTIFVLQEDEAEEYNEDGIIQEFTSDENEVNSEMGTTQAVELATKASKWSQTYLGTPLSKLPLDATTVTEVLRLHLLSSGCGGGARGAAWRYQQRGGYSPHDDPALQLRRRRPALLAALHAAHVASLPLDNKLEILQCLMNQLLSYAAFRDVIEEKLEDFKNKKHTLRTIQANERKREMQLIAARQELRKEGSAKKEEQKLTGEEAKTVDADVKIKIEKLNKESDDRRKEYEKKVRHLQEELFDFASYLGSDRAFRRYYVGRRVPGVFVEAGIEAAGASGRGPCRDKPMALRAHPRPDDVLAYVTSLFEQQPEKGGSDKENDSAANSRGNTPKKPLASANGVQKSPGVEPSTAEPALFSVCTGDIDTCSVHGKVGRPQWSVYHTEEQIEALIQSLNKRGLRESELKQNLEQEKASLVDYARKCPVYLLTPLAEKTVAVSSVYTRRRPATSLPLPPGGGVPAALDLALRDHVLELEEKIFHGCLGALRVKDREAWRGTIMVRGYDKQADCLRWGPKKQYTDKPNGVLDPEVKPIVNKYRDPGHYLETIKINGIKKTEVDIEPNLDTLKFNGIKTEDTKPSMGVTKMNGTEESVEDMLTTVRNLASALLQVEQAVHHKYLKRPLGLDDKERKEREAKNKPLDLDALDRWEVSLMESKSFAQVVLHLLTLDSSITWSASILNASCKLCRRKTDPDNMLLCDGCNKGHHLYCLKPKLTKVPEGDWFCEQCKPKPTKERTPRKKRKLFSDDDVDDDSDRSEGELERVDGAVCGVCGSGGVLAARCARCASALHAECAPSRRVTCARCAAPPTRAASSRRCAAAAIDNIHHFARALSSRKNSSDSEDSEYNTVLVKLKQKKTRGSKEASPLVNGQRKNSRRSKENVNTSTRKSNNNTLTNGHAEDRPSRRKRNAVKLHVEALEQLLKEVMKHKDSWPFYDPVNIEDVPDYFEIIDEPMDLATIKKNLEENKYSADDELLSDLALIFRNCFTYNLDSHPVARAGLRLEKYIQKRCSELELPPMPETEAPAEDEDVSSNKRRKSSEDNDAPKSKKSKLK